MSGVRRPRQRRALMASRSRIPVLSLLSSSYDLPFHHGKRRRSFLSNIRLALVALVLVLVLLYWLSTKFRNHPISRVPDLLPWPSMLSTAHSYPMSFEQIRKYERRLPQHDISLPPPEGINGRTLMFSNEVWGLGLNNQLNDR